MLTFNQIYSEAQAQMQDTSAATLGVLKRAINQGMHKFGAILNREWRLQDRLFTTVASQQYYQMPEDAIRIANLSITVGSTIYPVVEVTDREVWDRLCSTTSTSTIPEYFFVKGSDQFGIWPTPSTNGYTGTLTIEPAMRDMTADDYSTGTITVTASSQAVVGSSTTFTAAMIGRTLFADPTGGTGDGSGYKISAFTDTTHISLENYYAGASSSGMSYLIGQVPDIPEEFHESLVDYALYRGYKRRRDRQAAADCKSLFDEAVNLCQQNYSSKTSSQYVRAQRPRSGYVHRRTDLRIT
jgi:hypothetical protein